VVEHTRQKFGGKTVDYRHYLPELARKPQAVRQVADVLVGELGPPYDILWRELVDEQGPRQAARVLAQVLGAIIERGEATVSERIQVALASGEPILLALKEPEPPAKAVMPEQLPGVLRDSCVPMGRAAEYDFLLGGVA
jgi:hypothetical protein